MKLNEIKEKTVDELKDLILESKKELPQKDTAAIKSTPRTVSLFPKARAMRISGGCTLQ